MTLVKQPSPPVLARATTLRDAMDVLNPEPLRFEGEGANAGLYIPHPSRIDEELSAPPPGKLLRSRLLKSTSWMKAFLSGHVGSGKSTELRSLAADQQIQAAFFPIWLDVEPGYWDKLDVAQLLFLIACVLFDYGRERGLHTRTDLWAQPFRVLDETILGKHGLDATEGALELKFNLVFVELRQELKVEDRRRKQFRELAENNLKILIDLIAGLCADIRFTAGQKGIGRDPLLIIDGLDKVRERAPQDATFRGSPDVLVDLPLRVIYTLPTGVAFEDCPKRFQEHRVHLYPAPLLKKANLSFNPEAKDVVNEVGLDFFEKVLRLRVDNGLFEPDAVRQAAVYSGGVLRSFFWLLRSAIEVAEENELDTVDARVMRAAIKTARLNESMSLHEKEYKTLAEVHRTNYLPNGDGKYLDQSWVIECFNDKVWYEANPLFWKVLEPKS